MGDNNHERVGDIRVAEEGAYAAKPFEDALREYGDQMPEAAREELTFIADEEAEKAMAAFEQTKSLEDPRIAALRALASETVTLGNNTYAFDNEGTAKEVKGMLKQLGGGLLDRLIADEKIDFPTKAERIKGLGLSMNEGMKLALHSHAWPEDITKEYCKEFGRGAWSTDNTADILRGYFAATIMTGNGSRSVAALAEIGRLESRNPTEVISEHMPLILELRRKYPEVVNRPFGQMGPTGTRLVRALDYGLETQGFLWNPGAGTYVHMGSPPTSTTAPK